MKKTKNSNKDSVTNLSFVTTRNLRIKRSVLFLFGLFLILGNSGCSNKDEKSDIVNNGNNECAIVYSSFFNVLKDINENDLGNTDLYVYADSIADIYMSLNIIDKNGIGIFSNKPDTKSIFENGKYPNDYQSTINNISISFHSTLMEQIWKDMFNSTINGNLSPEIFLHRIANSDLNKNNKKELSLILSYYNYLCLFDILPITKGSFDDCYSEYLENVHNAKIRAAVSLVGGIAGAIAGAIYYRMDLAEAEKTFDDCVK